MYTVNGMSNNQPVGSYQASYPIALPTIFNLIEDQWSTLTLALKANKDAYYFRHLAKMISQESNPYMRFQKLFQQIHYNVFGNKSFLPEHGYYCVNCYIKAEQTVRDFDLITFWKSVRRQYPSMPLPEYNKATEIRSYLQTNPVTITAITQLHFNGISELWESWHKRYGVAYGLPDCHSGAEIHAFIDEMSNQNVCQAVVSRERDSIVEHTTRIPPEIKHFINLEKLTIANRKAWFLPNEIYTLPHIKNLDIHYTSLKKLSKNISQLGNTEISILGAELAGLPHTIGQLPQKNIRIINKDGRSYPSQEVV